MTPSNEKESEALQLVLEEVQQLKSLFKQKLEQLSSADEKLESLKDEVIRASHTNGHPDKYEYLNSLGHEMRLPLNKLGAMCDLLLNSDLQEKQRQYAETIRSYARALSEIINDVSFFTKLESGDVESHELTFAPIELIEGCAQLFSKKATEKNLMLMTYVAPSTPLRVHGDPVRIRKVLQNLIHNAVKFTEQGEIVLSVTGKIAADGKQFVEFSVSDTGSGISTDIQNRLFQPFDRPANRTTRSDTGSGLGLAICKTLVRSMGGEIGARANDPHGAIFWFSLPLVGLNYASAKDDDLGLGHMRLLVVHGEAGVSQILQSYADSWKIHCLSVTSKKEALKQIVQEVSDNNPFDIVITEHQLPDGDAFQLIDELRKKNKLMTPKFILLTAEHDPVLSTRYKPAGFSAYLNTPVTQSDVFDCLATVMMQTIQ